MPDVKDKNKAICRLSAYSLFFSNSPQTGFYSIFPSVLFSVIPSEAEESRGNEMFGLFSFLALSNVAERGGLCEV